MNAERRTRSGRGNRAAVEEGWVGSRAKANFRNSLDRVSGFLAFAIEILVLIALSYVIHSGLTLAFAGLAADYPVVGKGIKVLDLLQVTCFGLMIANDAVRTTLGYLFGGHH